MNELFSIFHMPNLSTVKHQAHSSILPYFFRSRDVSPRHNFPIFIHFIQISSDTSYHLLSPTLPLPETLNSLVEHPTFSAPPLAIVSLCLIHTIARSFFPIIPNLTPTWNLEYYHPACSNSPLTMIFMHKIFFHVTLRTHYHPPLISNMIII